MTQEEYKAWKENNSEEFNTVYQQCLENWVKETIKHELDDVAFRSPTVIKELQEVSYRKALEALVRKDDYCHGLFDDLVKMHKQYNDYKTNRK